MKTPLTPTFDWPDVFGDADLLRHISGPAAVGPSVDGRWVHWDRLRHLDPPSDLDHEQWWSLVKLARSVVLQPMPINDSAGRNHRLAVPPMMLERLHHIDAQSTGRIGLAERIGDAPARNRWLAASLEEEAIRSSQLEGASTSRAVAKEMLRTGRDAMSRGEQMILNNYHAMQFVRSHRHHELTPDLVRELHRIVTERTLEDPMDAGRVQVSGEERVRVWADDGELLHHPPPAGELDGRMRAMCDFANARSEGEDFLHPVVRSILLHYWLAYDHPFVDGNGRTARALFYWSMLHRDYWLAEYLTISTILRTGHARYVRSFLYTEIDEGDLTYFVLHHLDVIERAIRGLEDYLERKMAQVGEANHILRTGDFNHRQASLLEDALRHPHADYTIRGHADSHGVVYQTSRTDLLDLSEQGFLEQRRIGRAFHFFPVEDLHRRLGTD